MKLSCKLLCLSLCFFLVGCDIEPLLYQEVTIMLPEKHPWQEATHKPLWHTLVYSDTRGSLTKIHLDKGVRSVTLKLRRDCLTVFCAYPLSFLFPYGGFYQPGEKGFVELSQEKGSLAKLLLDSYQYNPQAVQQLDAVYLSSLVKEASLVDGQQLMVDLLNGSFVKESIIRYEPFQVSLSDLPQGYWIGERTAMEPFWSYWDRETRITINHGLVRYLNQDRSLCLTIYGIAESQSCITSLGKAPVW